MKDGIYQMPEEEYRALPYANQSAVKTLALGGTPAHYKAAVEGDQTDTDAKTFGRLVHQAVLEPELFANVEMLPPNIRQRRGADWEQLQADNPGITFLPKTEYGKFLVQKEQAERVRDSVLNHPVASNLLKNVGTEQVVIWTDPETGVKCKAKLDILQNDFAHIADLKTTSRPGIYQSVRSGYFYGYHIQVAMYTDAICIVKGLDLENPPPFWYIFVESMPPYLCFVADAHAAFDERIDNNGEHAYLELGRQQYKAALKTVASCQESGSWEGYQLEPTEMAIPKFAGWE